MLYFLVQVRWRSEIETSGKELNETLREARSTEVAALTASGLSQSKFDLNLPFRPRYWKSMQNSMNPEEVCQRCIFRCETMWATSGYFCYSTRPAISETSISQASQDTAVFRSQKLTSVAVCAGIRGLEAHGLLNCQIDASK